MKIKNILLVCGVAVLTLSFTFINVSSEKSDNETSKTPATEQSAPAGGFGAEEIVK